MDKNDFIKIIELHKLSTKLKTTLREGWVRWKVENTRIESIAEHVFGTCMLAVGILSSLNLDLNINKIITMLMLHETEEIIIGDITPFDKQAILTKKEDGRNAVLSIFKDFPNSQHFLDIIEEFEECKTKEAKFAKQCDKFEADLQSWYYKDNFCIDKVDREILNDSRIVALQEKGYNRICDWFLQNDKKHYEDHFIEMANYLEELQK